MNNNKLVKIIVPILIVVVIAGMWFVKDRQTQLAKEEAKRIEEEKKAEKAEKEKLAKEEAEKAGKPVDENAPDFTFEFTEKLDFDALKKHGLPIIADFGSERCGPCVHMHPDLEAIHGEYEGRAFVKYADVWNSPEAVDNLPIRVTPTQVLVTAEGKPYVPSEEVLKKMGPTSFTSYNDKKTGEHVLTVHEGILTQDDFRLILKEMGVKQ